MKQKIHYLFMLLLMLLTGLGGVKAQETEVYSTGFESGFGTGTVYNNTTVSYYGPSNSEQKWGIYYGTVSSTSPLTGNNSIQCRYYGNANSVEPYAFMNFDLQNVTSISFKSKVSNTNLSLLLQYSTNEGNTWTDAQTFSLTKTATDYTYSFETAQEKVRFKFLVKHTNKISSGNQQFYLDDVIVKGETSSSSVATTTTINASGITNTDVYTSKTAGQLTATVNAGQTTIDGASVTWESSNPGVATIDGNGNVTLVAAGITTITATYAGEEGKYEGSSATFTLTVTDNTPFEGGEVTFVGGTDLGSTTSTGDDQMTKSVVTVSSTSAAFATAEYRLYANSTTTFSVPEGYYIKKIIFTDADTKNPCSNLARKNGTAGEFDSETLTWTGASSTVVFVASAQARASQIVVTVATGTPKQSPTVEISATELEVNGDVATATVTTNGPAVTLSTSDPAVASVSGTTVTAVAAGTATITATWEENDTYVGGTKTFTVTVIDNTPVTTDWVKTELADLAEGDIFVIVGNNGSNYALANDKGTSAAPTAVGVTVSGNYLTSSVADNIKWNVSGNATDGYTFYPNGSITTWLYTTNDNNGVRVGTNDNKLFTIDEGYLKNSGTSRYVGIYNSADWRCYTSINNNIKDQTFAFYKYTGAPQPSITASDVEIAFDATSGSISYAVENSVEGGTLAATTEADWLTIGTVSENVPFTTTANETAIARTADVVLTYTYGTSTTSKTITVTQAGNPNAPGTVNNPYTVAEALAVIEALADNGKTSDVYVRGTISSITEVSVYDAAGDTGYGNATYFISDGTSELEVFRGYFLDEAKFTAEDQIQEGDEVVVYGKLQKYVKGGNTTPEVTQGNYIVSLDRPEPVVLSAPIIFHDGGEYEGTLTVAMAGEGTIKYTLNDNGETKDYTAPFTISETTTIKAWTEQDGAKSDEVERTFTIVEKAKGAVVEDGYYTIQTNDDKYVNVAGRKTVTLVSDTKSAGTVIRVKADEDGVKVLRSQAVDLPRYAERAMSYVPEIVKEVVKKLAANVDDPIIGEQGADLILDKFKKEFDYHLYLEGENNTYRIYGRTPSMKPVVDFYAENKELVDSRLLKVEDFVKEVLQKIVNKVGRGQSVVDMFKVKTIWQNMGGTLTEPTDDASTLKFYEEVLSSETNVWNFAYQTGMLYWEKVKGYLTENAGSLGDYGKYLEKIPNVRPNFRYYIVPGENGVDIISEGNSQITDASTAWTLTKREGFDVTFDATLSKNNGKEMYKTLYVDFGYKLPDGVTALKVTAIDENTGVAKTEEIGQEVAPQTPVLLKSDKAGDITLTIGDNFGSAVTDNLLKGNDYLINTYDINTSEVEGIFNILAKLSQSLADEYSYLKRRNAGTVNNKYFFGLTKDDLKLCYYLNDNEEKDCVVRSLSMGDEKLGFYNNWTAKANEAFLVSEQFNPVKLTLKGDVNRSGDVTVADVNALVEIVLGKVTEPDNTHDFDAAHVNADEEITIADVTALVNIILGKTQN